MRPRRKAGVKRGKPMIVKTDDLDQNQIYKLLIGSVVPRPIAWVSTVSSNGVANLATIFLLHRSQFRTRLFCAFRQRSRQNW